MVTSGMSFNHVNGLLLDNIVDVETTSGRAIKKPYPVEVLSSYAADNDKGVSL